MSNYIKRKDAIDEIAGHLGVPAQIWIGEAAKWLNEVPAADVVEIVRCKDCYFKGAKLKTPQGEGGSILYCCRLSNRFHDEEWYCASAERDRYERIL